MALSNLRTSTSGGKERLGRTSKMGERSLRRLLISGASAVARWAARKGVPAGSWLVRVALANKMARIVWALLARGGIYRAPVAAGEGAAPPRDCDGGGGARGGGAA